MLLATIVAPPHAEVNTTTGFPQTTVTASEPSRYIFEVRANLMSTSSCGGIAASTLGREQVHVQVNQP